MYGWKYLIKTSQLLHIESGRCAQAETSQKISLAKCQKNFITQQWTFSEMNKNLINEKLEKLDNFLPPNTLL